MNVLMWVNYGAVRVMKAELPHDFEKIREAIVDATDGWGLNVGLEELRESLGASRHCGDARHEMLKFVWRHIGPHRTFEYFEFVTVEA